MPLTVFEISVSFAHSTDEGMREKTLSALFTAEDEAEALRSGVRFSENRLEALYTGKNSFYNDPKAFVCCIKLHPITIGAIDPEGHTSQARGFCIFEWKYDWPGSLEDTWNPFATKSKAERLHEDH